MSKKVVPKLRLPESDNGYDEITIVIVGNVDSGKSSLCGILSHPNLRDDKKNISNILDDGNGLSRKRVLTLSHEKETGRTSSISYNYMIFDNNKPRPCIVSLVDLAGHEEFLKTTVTGIMSSYPEYGLILVSKNITNMTKEHYSILATMGIPILFVLTKIDIIPNTITEENIGKIGILSKKYGKTTMKINNINDVDTCINDSNIFGYIMISNKTGVNLDLLIYYISKVKQHKKKKLINGFAIYNVYKNVTGFGLIVSGITGINIKKGSNMVLGPFAENLFIPVKIRTIHNDYRHFVEELQAGTRGCLCIRIDDKYKNFIRMGMVICNNKIDIISVKKFEAYISVFRGNKSNIKVGYNSYINMNLVRGGIKIIRLIDPETNKDIANLREKKHTIAHIEFITNYNTVNINDKFLFRSNRCLGIGKVINFI